MPRVAFQLRIKAGKEKEYEEAHRRVWPELLAKIKEVGISKYSSFGENRICFWSCRSTILTSRGAHSIRTRRI